MSEHQFDNVGHCKVCGMFYLDIEQSDAPCEIRLAVVGSRSFNDYELLSQVLGSVKTTICSIVSGGAKGADSLAAKYALEHSIPLHEILPDWDKLGRKAGFVRNREIVASADALIAFWNMGSKGTAHTIQLARDANIPMYIKEI